MPALEPSPHLLEELISSRSTFEELRKRAVELAGLLSRSQATRVEEVQSLAELRTLIQSLGEAQEKRSEEEKIKQQALTVLDRVLSVEHCDDIEFPPLAECQHAARELRRAVAGVDWPDIHPDVSALAHRRHPLAEFLTLVERHLELDDDLWLLLKHAVSESFGKKLSLAAARGRLFVSEQTRIVALDEDAQDAEADQRRPIGASSGQETRSGPRGAGRHNGD